MDIFSWIAEELRPEVRTTAELLYDGMASQSGGRLPIIYLPFDAGDVGHWCDRGSAMDFALSTQCQGRRVLDFGPGDGWPSLLLAPFAGEVVGVDGSPRRVAVCAENAARLGIANASFRHVAPGAPLPFDDGSFDAIVAATSVEQTPNPRATLAEFHRVLRPGGRLRLSYEALGRYRGGEEREAWLLELDHDHTRLFLYDRAIDEEQVLQMAVTFRLSSIEVARALGGDGDTLTLAAITVDSLARLLPAIIDTGACTTRHPSCGTWMRWLSEVGFSQVLPTHSGAEIAGRVFGTFSEDERPDTLERIDAYLRPIVAVAVELSAPAEIDPMITAVK